MARSVLVSAIMAGARRRADDEEEALADNAEIISYIDQAFGRYYDVLTSADPEFYQAEATITTVAGTKLYALPATWFGTLHIDRLDGDQYINVPRLRPDQRLHFAQNGQPTRYRLEQQQVALYPTPSAVYTLRHTYIPSWTAITLSSQSIDGLLGNEDLIELEVAIRLQSKEFDGDASAGLVAERASALERLQARAFKKNVVEAQIVGLNNLDDRDQLEGDWPRRRWW